MAQIYDTLVRAVTAHWKAHGNAYPRKIILPPKQFGALLELRQRNRSEKALVDLTKFMGVALEEHPGAQGVLVDVDGKETPLQL